MKLNAMEKETALWKKIEDELKARLQVLREKNDGQLSEQETAKLRGNIAAMKEILGWATPTPNITGD